MTTQLFNDLSGEYSPKNQHEHAHWLTTLLNDQTSPLGLVFFILLRYFLLVISTSAPINDAS
jgi:hypothetical protein